MGGRRLFTAIFMALLGIASAGAARAADDTIKIGYIDPFSGPFAATGNNFLKVFNFILEKANAQGGPLGKSMNSSLSTISCSQPRRLSRSRA